MFNTQGNYCDWPSNVACNNEESQSSTTAVKTTSELTPMPSTLSTTSTIRTTASDPESSMASSTTEIIYTSTQTAIRTTETSSPLTTSTVSTTLTTTFVETTTFTEKTETTTESDVSSTTIATSTTTGAFSLDHCVYSADEPITSEVQDLRTEACLFPNMLVEAVVPGRAQNPENVLILESLLSEEIFKFAFPSAHPHYTYSNLLKAFAKFPAVCKDSNSCRRDLSVMFAHFQQETAGLYYIEEISPWSVYCSERQPWVFSSYPCTPGMTYWGRGAKQLSWNYNYGAFSVSMYGNASVLLNNPELVANTWLNFASALWFMVTPQPPKPSMMAVIDGSWKPNNFDLFSGLVPGFGATTMIINGGLECGTSPSNTWGSENRQKYYGKFSEVLQMDIASEVTSCEAMKPFSSSGSANPSIYWAPEQGCKLVYWQTAFSALVDGNYERCLQNNLYMKI